jgi:hypothetical protein
MAYNDPAEIEKRNRDLESKNSELRTAIREMKEIVENSLVTLDWATKLGVVVGVWFFPVPADKWTQALGLAGYGIVTTIISIGLRKMKALKAAV